MLDPENLIEELNLDDTPENVNLVASLIKQSEAFIQDSVDPDTELTEFEKDLLFKRTVYTLATQLYYDRTLVNGTSKGLQMMLNHLDGKVTDGGFKPTQQ